MKIRISRSDSEHIDFDAGADFHELVRSNLERPVSQAKEVIAKAVAITANKLKIWAMTHLQQAANLGRKTELFEKIINNPVGTATQIANSMMGIRGK